MWLCHSYIQDSFTLQIKMKADCRVGCVVQHITTQCIHTHIQHSTAAFLKPFKSCLTLGHFRRSYPPCSYTIKSLYTVSQRAYVCLLAKEPQGLMGRTWSNLTVTPLKVTWLQRSVWALSSTNHDCLCKTSWQSIKKLLLLLLLLAEWEICDITRRVLSCSCIPHSMCLCICQCTADLLL